MSFNPRSRVGSDARSVLHFFFRRVSIHAPAKGTTGTMQIWNQHIAGCNPRSREGNDMDSANKRAFVLSCNPRSREGNDLNISQRIPQVKVAIHVPAKGTTKAASDLADWVGVAIHVPAKGTTNMFITYIFLFDCCNPRSREGNDSSACWHWPDRSVAIHVPAKGTTACR